MWKTNAGNSDLHEENVVAVQLSTYVSNSFEAKVYRLTILSHISSIISCCFL